MKENLTHTWKNTHASTFHKWFTCQLPYMLYSSIRKITKKKRRREISISEKRMSCDKDGRWLYFRIINLLHIMYVQVTKLKRPLSEKAYMLTRLQFCLFMLKRCFVGFSHILLLLFIRCCCCCCYCSVFLVYVCIAYMYSHFIFESVVFE